MLRNCRLKVVRNHILTQVSFYFEREETRIFVLKGEVIDADRPVRVAIEDGHEVCLYLIERLTRDHRHSFDLFTSIRILS